MTKAIKKIVFLLTLFLLFSCNKDDHKIKMTFLQVNDVYEISPLEGGKVGGMARVKTLHKELLKENPNTFLFMAGDFLNPSLIATMKYKGEKIRGKQMIDVMNAMHFDLVSFGNHEFDLKYKDLQKRFNESNFQWISTNARHKLKNGQVVPFYVEHNSAKTDIPRTYILNVKDADGTAVKIGFFAPCINSNPKDYVDYGDFYEDSKKAYRSLENKTDFVVGLTHLKQEQDEMIAKMLPKVPLIMGGHEHTARLVPVGNCTIAKADANARTAYVHRLEYDTKTKQLKISSTLVPIDDKLAFDDKVDGIVKRWAAILDDKIKSFIKDPNEVVFVANTPLDGRDIPIRSRQTNLGMLIAKAMSAAYDDKVDAAFFNGGSVRIDDRLQGNITGVDVFRILPFGGSVLKVNMTGRLLEKVLKYGKLTAGKGSYLQRHNIDYDQEHKIWKVRGKPIDKNKIYSIATSDYLLKGLDIPFLRPENKNVIKVYAPKDNETAADVRNAVITLMKKEKHN